MQNNNILKSAKTNTGEIVEWILCPVCNSKTRIKIRSDTILENFPLYCPKCKNETLINIQQFRISVIKEPDAQPMTCRTFKLLLSVFFDDKILPHDGKRKKAAMKHKAYRQNPTVIDISKKPDRRRGKILPGRKLVAYFVHASILAQFDPPIKGIAGNFF